MGRHEWAQPNDIYRVKIFNGIQARQAESINLRSKERQARPAKQQQKRFERHQEVLRKLMMVFAKNMAGWVAALADPKRDRGLLIRWRRV